MNRPGQWLHSAQPQTQQGLTIEQFEKMQPKVAVEKHGKKMIFNTPSLSTMRRVSSMLESEAVTIAWLDGFENGEVMLDIGASVGLYSIYAAVMRDAEVHAFEPEGQNFSLLNRNIADNSLGGRVTAYPLALSNTCKLDRLYLSEIGLGGKCHSFGEEVGLNLKLRPAAFRQGAVSITVDEAVRSRAIPLPHHIKIEIDGMEHLVIEGARETLANPRVKSLLVELNTSLAEHMAVINTLDELGFTHDIDQFQQSIRTSGTFLGVGKAVFTRNHDARISSPHAVAAAPASFLQTNDPLEAASNAFARPFNIAIPGNDTMRDVLWHILRRIDEQPIVWDPFPHILVDGIFPGWYYEAILENFPDEDSLVSIGETGRVTPGAYKERLCVPFNTESLARLTPEKRKFWVDFGSCIYCDLFIGGFINKFAAALENRLQIICGGGSPLSIRSNAILVSDRTNYALGPHTDAPHRLMSLLFYMPRDESLKELGTSFYRPKDPAFTCWGGPHYGYENFERTSTVDFLPNRMIAFVKTDRSFHGVEPISRGNVDRRLLINNIRILNPVKY